MATAQDVLGHPSVNKTTDLFKCADRVSPGDEPKDITAIKHLYVPFDIGHEAVHVRRNPFGVQIYRMNITAGNIYQAFDGKRLVVEVGCSTIVYVLINPSMPGKHHRIFIQSESAFSGDTTIRKDAAIIAKNTRHVETVVKYEMYFIMGVLSTASLAAWVLVTGSDVTYMYAQNRMFADEAKKLSTKLLSELEQIKTYAPTLHAKLIELVLAEGSNVGKAAISSLPKVIVNDEKTQAQVAGILFGKWASLNGNPFGVWSIVGVVLTQAATKSVTKFGDAFTQAIDGRYKPLLDQMREIDRSNPASFQRPAQSLIQLMGEAGVTLTHHEAVTILTEITSNSDKAFRNISNIVTAIDQFRRAAKK